MDHLRSLAIRDLSSNILHCWEQMLFCGHLALRSPSLHAAIPLGDTILPSVGSLGGIGTPDACLPLWKTMDQILPTMLSFIDTANRFSPRILNI